MPALGTLSAGGAAAGFAGLLRLRNRGPAVASPAARAGSAVHDGGQLVWGRQLRPALILPNAGLLPSQASKRLPLRPVAASASSEPAG